MTWQEDGDIQINSFRYCQNWRVYLYHFKLRLARSQEDQACPGKPAYCSTRPPSFPAVRARSFSKSSHQAETCLTTSTPSRHFLKQSIIANTELLFAVAGATPFHFGVLSSAMHMAWVRNVCGLLKSDYRYSAGIVYNNFPWPEATTANQKQAIEIAAQGVLDARAKHPQSSMADLYDPLAMPADLAKAHQKLDAVVDAAFREKDLQGTVTVAHSCSNSTRSF